MSAVVDGRPRGKHLLAGVLVVDFSRFVAGPYCTMLLADLGARVIKVENVVGGDSTRKWGRESSGPNNGYFMSVNRNKESVAVDLTTEGGRDIARRLVALADVVVHNFRDSAATRFGISYAQLKTVNPSLVYCQVRGFGKGAREGIPAMDFVIQAESGLMEATGAPDGAVSKVPFPVSDILAALHSAVGVASALVRRQATGEGCLVETSLLEAALSSMTNLVGEYLVDGIEPSRLGTAHRSSAPYEVHPAADGPLAVGVSTEAQWRRFCKLLGLDRIVDDERFRVNPRRIAHRAELNGVIDPVLATRTVDEWVALFETADVPCGRVRTLSQALASEDVRQLHLVGSVEHPRRGTVKMIRSPLSVDECPADLGLAPPELGADTLGVLRELLKITDQDVSDLRMEGCVGVHEGGAQEEATAVRS